MRQIIGLLVISIILIPIAFNLTLAHYGAPVISIVFPVRGANSYGDDFGAPRSGGRTHQGNDIFASKGTPLAASASGFIDSQMFGFHPTAGYRLWINGVDGNAYFYAHLNNDTPGTDDGMGGYQTAYAPGVGPGVWVSAGQILGYNGDSGNAEGTPPHLHFEIHPNGGGAVCPKSSLDQATTSYWRHETFSETGGLSEAQTSTTSYFPWYDQVSPGMSNWLLVANPNGASIDFLVKEGQETLTSYSLSPGKTWSPIFYGRYGDLFQVNSTNGQRLGASQRVHYRESFNELMGLPAERISTRVIFPWYDQVSRRMVANLLVTNPNPSSVNVTVKREGSEILATFSIGPGQTWTPSFPGKIGGPLEVVSDQPVLASQRVDFNGNFNELMGLPQELLSTRIIFPWYDQRNPGMGDNLLVANPGASPAAVTVVREGSEVLATFSIGPGQTWTPSFPGKIGGPLEVVSDQPVLASQRVHYQGSFNEIMGTPQGDLSTKVIFPWYDQAHPGMRNWLLVANPNFSPATITVRREGSEILAHFALGPGQTLPLNFPGKYGGPLEVTSNQPVLASQRVHFDF